MMKKRFISGLISGILTLSSIAALMPCAMADTYSGEIYIEAEKLYSQEEIAAMGGKYDVHTVYSGGTAITFFQQPTQPIVNIEVEIPESGEYRMEFCSSEYQENADWISPFKIKINDREYANISAWEEENVEDTSGEGVNWMRKYSKSMPLDAGKNTIQFTASKMAGKDLYSFFLDYVKLVKDNAPETVTIDALNYDSIIGRKVQNSDGSVANYQGIPPFDNYDNQAEQEPLK